MKKARLIVLSLIVILNIVDTVLYVKIKNAEKGNNA